MSGDKPKKVGFWKWNGLVLHRSWREGVYRLRRYRSFRDKSHDIGYWTMSPDQRANRCLVRLSKILEWGTYILAIWSVILAVSIDAVPCKSGITFLVNVKNDSLLSWLSNFLTLLAGLVAILTKRQAARAAHRKWMDFELHPAQARDIAIGNDYEAAGYAIEKYSRGRGLWSKALSEWMIENRAKTDPKTQKPKLELKIQVDETEFHGEGWVMKNLGPKVAAERLAQGKRFSDDEKIRLKNGSLFMNPPSGEIVFEKTTYLVSICTGDLVGQVAIGKDEKEFPEYDPLKIMLNSTTGKENELVPFEQIPFSKQLGASSLVFTSDRYLMLVEQLGGNINSANLLAPSGSGSYEWSDLKERKSNNFVVWATEAAKREFLEESGLDPIYCEFDVPVLLAPIGFGLFLDRGAKPEMFFLGRMGATRDEYRTISRYSSIEKNLAESVAFEEEFRLAAWDATSIIKVLNKLKANKERLSMPLEMAVSMAIHVCTKCAKDIDEFLNAFPPIKTAR